MNKGNIRDELDNSIPRRRQRTWLNELNDNLWIIGLIFVGVAIIMWAQGTIKSILISVFVTLPYGLWNEFWLLSDPTKFFVIGIIILIPFIIKYIISEDSDRRRYYERKIRKK